MSKMKRVAVIPIDDDTEQIDFMAWGRRRGERDDGALHMLHGWMSRDVPDRQLARDLDLVTTRYEAFLRWVKTAFDARDDETLEAIGRIRSAVGLDEVDHDEC